jgi:hypothetical protein
MGPFFFNGVSFVNRVINGPIGIGESMITDDQPSSTDKSRVHLMEEDGSVLF